MVTSFFQHSSKSIVMTTTSMAFCSSLKTLIIHSVGQSDYSIQHFIPIHDSVFQVRTSSFQVDKSFNNKKFRSFSHVFKGKRTYSNESQIPKTIKNEVFQRKVFIKVSRLFHQKSFLFQSKSTFKVSNWQENTQSCIPINLNTRNAKKCLFIKITQ